MIGRRLAHYTITDVLGAGGMGEVYRATDTKLGRDVALKVLPARTDMSGERLERFQREARALAVLDHPAIVTVYSVEEADGIPFLTMQLVEGKPLDQLIPPGGLPVSRLLELAGALAAALEAAHAKCVIHRDLKPSNIMIGSSGQVKVLDFGLAKFAACGEGAAADLETRTGLVTLEGTTLGTLPYMSPEQIVGQPVDHRTDVYSFGVLLYEMATGRRPFHERRGADLAAAILSEAPPRVDRIRPELPAAVADIVAACLAKKAGDRIASAAALAEKLRAVADGGARQSATVGPSIAVLPFQNLSHDPENEYFSDGLAEEILNALTQIQGLQVAARTSSFSFKGKTSDITDIAAKLRVGTVLDGSVRRAGSRVRVTVQLVDATNGFQLWSERYDREMRDIFDVQDEIARAVTDRLKVTLGRAVQRGTQNPEAYELYLKGRHHWHQRTPTTIPKAMECFRQAIAIDPEYALAHAALADCYGILRVYGWISCEEGRDGAHAAVARAVELAPARWEVQFSRGFYQFYFERDWKAAGPFFEQAAASNPRSSLAQLYFGLFLATANRQEGVMPTERALQLDPLSPFIHAIAAVGLVVLDRLEEAERLSERALELHPDYLPALWPRGVVLSRLERHDEAIATLERAVTLSRAPLYVGLLGLVCARAGRRDIAARLLGELEERATRGEYVPAFTVLPIHIALGNVGAIREQLQRALDESVTALSLRVTSTWCLEPFRSDRDIDRMLRDFLG